MYSDDGDTQSEAASSRSERTDRSSTQYSRSDGENFFSELESSSVYPDDESTEADSVKDFKMRNATKFNIIGHSGKGGFLSDDQRNSDRYTSKETLNDDTNRSSDGRSERSYGSGTKVIKTPYHDDVNEDDEMDLTSGSWTFFKRYHASDAAAPKFSKKH